jgi:DNA primase
LIARFAKKVVLAFDADSAGQSAAARFYAWEARDDVTVSVAALPPGSDPGDLARTGPDELRKAIENATPFLGWRVHRALTSGSLATPEGSARAADASLAMLAEHPENTLLKEQYLVTIADRTRIPLDTLRDRLNRGHFKVTRADPKTTGSRQQQSANAAYDEPPLMDAPDFDPYDDYGGPPATTRGRQQTTRAPAAAVAGERAGFDALALAIKYPSHMAPRLDACLFGDRLQRATYEALANATDLHQAIERAPEPVANLLHRLAVVDVTESPDQTIVALVRAAANAALKELEADARQAQANGHDEMLAHVGITLAWVKPRLQLLQDPGVGETTAPPVTEAADALLGWLIGRQGEGA